MYWWLTRGWNHQRQLTPISPASELRWLSMGLAVTAALSSCLVSPCSFASQSLAAMRASIWKVSVQMTKMGAHGFFWPTFRSRAVSLPLNSVGYNWITKDSSEWKRRKWYPSPSWGNIKVTLPKSMRNRRYCCDHFYEKQSVIMCNK